MKTLLKNIGLCLIILCLFAGCEDWLSVTTNTEITAKDQFKSEQGFKIALFGNYISMASPELYAKDMTWNFVDILSHQYQDLGGDYLYVQSHQYGNEAVMEKIDDMWTNMYKTIANINLELAYIDKKQEVPGPIDYKIIKGELLGLRAFLHFDLMRLFGYGNLADRDVSGELTIPYVTEYTKLPTPRRSYTETFEMLLNDIQKALDLLKTDPVYKNPERPDDFYDDVNEDGFYDDRNYRMNYYAVKALQARVHLWTGGEEHLEKALAAANEVINESLQELVSNTANFYPEYIFALNVDRFRDIIQPHLNTGNQNIQARYMPPMQVQKVFETNIPRIGLVDVRYSKLMQEGNKGYVCVKFDQLFSAGTFSPVNTMPLITLSEMYYIAAEAYAKTNRLNKAIDYLNMVRTSRGIIESIPATADKETILREIGKEYRKEFVMQGQLFFYYKRVGKTSIPGYLISGQVGDEIYVLPYPDSQVILK